MSLPVSQYEALLAEVRGLRRKAQRVQQLATPLLSGSSTSSSNHHNVQDAPILHPGSLNYNMDPVVLDRHHPPEYDRIATSTEGETTCSEDECGAHSTQLSVSSEPISQGNRGMSMLYHGTWPVERTMWNSEPTNLGPSTQQHVNRTEMTSVMSFASSSGGAPLDRVLSSPDRSRRSSQQLEAKVDMVYSLLSMLGGQEHADMGETLLALSTSPESCLAMRQSGCIPLLVQLVQSDREADTRKKASQALHNLVHANPDEKLRKRETRVFKLLEQIRLYMAYLHNKTDVDLAVLSPSEDGDNHPVQTVAHLMKLSFDEGHRQAICQLGGIHAIANLVESEHALHGSTTDDGHCVLLRRYSCMALTNLTFGDSGNKALLCSFRDFMRALVLQLQSPCDELRQVTASVLRNLSWRADSTSKEILREVGAVPGLMKSAMINNKENTLKSILSALWNLSAHCTENKADICAVEEALSFLVSMLTYKTPSKSLAIIENAGGILRNISSQIAVRDDYREVLRENNCLQVLLDQLKSPSLTIVSNACGTLWNLSAKNQTDQELLWHMGAPAMLRSLNHSKHKMIAMGSSAALKNLLASRPSHNLLPQVDATARAMDLPTLPTLGARKQKALLQELEHNLSETFENIDKDSPVRTHEEQFLHPASEKEGPDSSNTSYIHKSQKRKSVLRSESQECVSHSERVLESRNSHSDTSVLSDSFNNTFANLSLNEPSSSFQNRSRISRGFASASLPYVKPYIPVQKFPSCSYKEEPELVEQPVDYSQKYLETKVELGSQKSFSFSNSVTNVDESFYAETDLDQPTDYSLRYAEDDSESEICTKIDKPDFVQDTVKTYCTEDTPYETPFNYSTATSMSDLRETALDAEKPIIDNDKSTTSNIKLKHKSMTHSDEKDHCSVEDISEIENRPKSSDKALSQLSSGLASPEKPINYADEGTPGCFSRVSSFGSLSGEKPKESVKPEPSEAKNEASPSESKAVKFEQVVNYAEETPLMFSRSSSLASLDSIEQHSIHEDRESVISDFSRLTSGIVSPSELPDSPTQTVPPSPRQRKPPVDFSTRPPFHRTPADGKAQSSSQMPQKSSVFEDNVTKFKEESTPMQFSTATSLSSLTIDDHDESHSDSKATSSYQKEGEEKKDAEQEKPDMPTVSESEEDEDILAACINDGMQNNRCRQNLNPQSKLSFPSTYKYQSKLRPHGSGIPLRSGIPRSNIASSPIRIPQSTVHSDSVRNYCTEDTPAMLSHAGSNTNLSLLTNTSDKKDEKYLSDDSSNLSGDNENILAECIQSAMPKAKKLNRTAIPSRPATALPVRNIQTSTPIKPFSRMDLRGEEPRRVMPYLVAKDEVESYAVENSPCHFSLHSSLSDLTIDGSVAGGLKAATPPTEEKERNAGPSSGNPDLKPPTSTLSRQESLSSLSADSLASLEQEQLLEQCISSAMPKSKAASRPIDIKPIKPVGVATKQFIRAPFEEKCKKEEKSRDSEKPKNVNATSAAGNTARISEACPTPPATAAGVEPTGGGPGGPSGTAGAPRDKCSPSAENLSTALTKSGCDKALGQLLEVHCEENIPYTSSLERSYSNSDNCAVSKLDKPDFDLDSVNLEATTRAVDTRMLDPDAMIESLDRFTAELVSQAEAAHSSKDTRKFTTSVTDGDTWNENTSSNDVTFPSISGSAPNVITFPSEHDVHEAVKRDEDMVDGVNEGEHQSNDFSSLNTSTMTESTLIAVEATKIATVFKNEAEMARSVTSVQSLELDWIQPPSHMNSLTNSTNGMERQSPKPVVRKKSLQSGLLARRALSNSLNQASSLESLDNHSLSNLDHMNPPSAMGEIDIVDMQGSMTSVASLPSETRDERPNPIFAVKQANLMHFLVNTSYSDLENVNPPSLFNEITDMCNSLADVTTVCSETEVFEDCHTHTDHALQTEDDVTLFSDAQSVTPIQSDLSSAETSPKKKSLSRRLTPKQKRKLAQERYKTYTVAAEMVTSGIEEELKSTTEEFKTVDCFSEYHTVASQAESPKSSGKVTPKERRQSDRARFQTQVLDEAVTSALQQMVSSSPKEPISTPTGSSPQSPQRSPARSKLSIRRNFMQKRLENQDRFKTRTLSESSLSPDISSASPPSNSHDLQSLVQKEASRVLRKLRETKSHPDELLDCETLSLISNDDDSEHNSISNYRTYTKNCGSRATHLPVAPPPIASSPVVLQVESEVQSEEPSEGPSENPSDEEGSSPAKPTIVKPGEKTPTEPIEESQPKAIRGRRKPLYSKSNVINPRIPPRISTPRPIRNITSNLVRNVTSAIKSSTNLKNVATKQSKLISPKPHAPPAQTKALKPPSGYKGIPVKPQTPAKPAQSAKGEVSRPNSGVSKRSNSGSPKPKGESVKSSNSSPLERQGTFTKDNQEPQAPKSRIPTVSNLPTPKTTSRIARAISHTNSTVERTVTRVQNAIAARSTRSAPAKSASSDRSNPRSASSGFFSRSSSADSRDSGFNRRQVHNSSSSQSLKSDSSKNGTVKKSSPSISNRSNSNSSLASNGSAKKQVTSKIASLWKKVEEQKKQVPKKDTRVWIQPAKEQEDESPRMIRSNTFESKDGVILRNKEQGDPTKRVSRLGSFIIMDDEGGCSETVNGVPELSF